MCGYLVKSFLLVHKKTTIVFKKTQKLRGQAIYY